jgi:hypothetical protein
LRSIMYSNTYTCAQLKNPETSPSSQANPHPAT